MILSNGFPQLRVCTVVGFDSLTPNSIWRGCPSLRILILDLRVPFDEEQIRSLCPNLRQYNRHSPWPLNPRTGEKVSFLPSLSEFSIISAIYTGKRELLLRQIIKVKEWESEKKFLLESWSKYLKTFSSWKSFPRKGSLLFRFIFNRNEISARVSIQKTRCDDC